MGLGTKNRQKQTADICKQHLREKYRDQRGLVEEFILEFEGSYSRLIWFQNHGCYRFEPFMFSVPYS